MEYGIKNKIKYTTLRIRSILVKKGISRKWRKWHRRESPQGGWGMGSKEPIQRMILLQRLKHQSTDKTELSWSLYRLKPRYYILYKKITNYVTKRYPWGDLSSPKSTLDRSFLSSLSDMINDSEHVRIKNSQNHFKSTFESAYFISKKWWN